MTERNFSWQNHNILRQRHVEGEPNGRNHLLVVNHFIAWLTYQYILVISKEMIYFLSDAFTQIPSNWVLSCWAAKKQKKTKGHRGVGIWDEYGLPYLYEILLYFRVICHALSGHNSIHVNCSDHVHCFTLTTAIIWLCIINTCKSHKRNSYQKPSSASPWQDLHTLSSNCTSHYNVTAINQPLQAILFYPCPWPS